MTWTSRGVVTLPSEITSSQFLIRGGPDGKIFYGSFGSGVRTRRFSLPALAGAATHDTAFRFGGNLTGGYINDAGTLFVTGLFTTFLFSYPVTSTEFGRSNIIHRNLPSAELQTLALVSPTRIYMYDGTQLVARNVSDGNLVGSSANIALVSGANASGLSNIRLITDGTHIWLTGITSNNRTARAWCYLLSDGSRVSARDFSQTFTHDVSYITTNAGRHFFVQATDGSQLDRYEFVVPADAVASGTVSNQTGTPGVAFSLDLSDSITGNPAPTFSERNDSLDGTGLALSGTGNITLSGTPTSSHVGAHTIELRANNRAGDYDFSFTFTVTRSLPTGTVANQITNAGTAFSLDLSDSISGTPDPTFSVRSSSLAGTGLSLNGTTGVLSGTPSRSQSGAHTIQLRASNASGNHDFSFTFTVRKVPVWTAISKRTVTVSTAFSLDVSMFIDADPTATVALRSGQTNPSGLSVDGTTVKWTPSATGDYTVYLTATNPAGSAHTSFEITVQSTNVAPSGSVINQTVNAGTAFSLDLATLIGGNPAPSFAELSASFPSWLDFSSSKPTQLEGTPARADSGTTTIQIRASNPSGSHDFSFSITVRKAPVWSTVPAQSETVDTAFTLDLDSYIDAFPAVTSVTLTPGESNPSGLSVSGTTISWTPDTLGDYTVYLTATNPVGSDTTSFAFSVVAALVAPAGTVANQTTYANVAFELDLATHITGNPAPSFTERNSSFPAWLDFSSSKPTLLEGTPTAVASAETIEIRASNSEGNLDFSFELTVIAGTAVTWQAIPNQTAYTSPSAQNQVEYELDLADYVSGVPTPTVTAESALPSWLRLDGTVLKGNTPTTAQAAVTLQFTGTNLLGSVDSATFTLTVTRGSAPAFMAGGAALPTAYVGRAYSAAVHDRFSGDPTPTFTAQYASGAANRPPFIALPDWLTFNSDGTFSGTPPAALYATNYAFYLRVTGTNAYGSFTTFASFQIRINKVPERTQSNIPVNAEIGVPFTFDLAPFFDLGIPAGTLALTRPPSWLTLTGTVLTGTYPDGFETETQRLSVVATATNSRGSAAATLNLIFAVPDNARWLIAELPDGGAAFPYRVDLATLVSGTPTPTVAITAGQSLPAGLTLSGTVLSATRLPSVSSDTPYSVRLTASNTVESVMHTADITLTLNVIPTGNKPSDYAFVNRLYLGWATLIPRLDMFARNRVVYHDVTVIGTGTGAGIFVTAGFIHQSGIQNNEEAVIRYGLDYRVVSRGSYHRTALIRNRFPFGIADDGTNLYILVAQAISTDSELLQKVRADRVTSITSSPTGLFNTEADLCFFAKGHIYVVDATSGVCVAHNPDGTRDANLDFTITGFTSTVVDAICYDDYEENVVIADDSAQLLRRYSLDGTQLLQTHAYTEIFGDAFSFTTHNVRVLGLGAYNGDLYAIAITQGVSGGAGRWNQYLGPLNRTHPFWKRIPDQEVVTDNNFMTSVDLNPLTHHDADIEIVPGSTLPAGASLSNGVFSYNPPPASRATAQTIYVQSSLRGETSFATFQVTGLSVPPVLSTIPTQNATAGVAFEVDLSTFVSSGSPAPDFTFDSSFTPPGWMRLTAGVLSGTPPIPRYRVRTTLSVDVVATNTQGSASASFSLVISPAPPGRLAPVWSTIPSQRAVGGRPFSFDVGDYYTGSPDPTLSVVRGATWLSADGSILSGTPPARNFISTTVVRVTIRVTNELGMADTILIIRVTPAGRLEFTRQIPLDDLNYPQGIVPQSMTATGDRIYIAAVGTNRAGQMLVYDWQGEVQSTEEFALGSVDSTSFGYSGVERIGERLYVLEKDFGVISSGIGRTQYVGVVRSYSLTGAAGVFFYVPHNTAPPTGVPPSLLGVSVFYRQLQPAGLAYEGSRFYVGTQVTARQGWRIATFDEEGEQGPITDEIILPSNITVMGIAESEQHFYILGGSARGIDIGRYSKTFSYIPGFDIILHRDNQNPLGLGYGDGEIAVLDRNEGIFIYGSPVATTGPTSPTAPVPEVPRPPVQPVPVFPYTPTIIVVPGVAPPVQVGRYRQYEAMDEWVSYFDILRPTGVGSYQLLALGVEAIVQSVSYTHLTLPTTPYV